jgi:hypothetical protein
MWREGDQMRQRMGITLASDLEGASLAAENKRDRSGSLDNASRLMSGLSLSNASADRKSSSSTATATSSSKPVLNSRAPVANGRRSLDAAAAAVASPEDDGQVTQGDMLRQRRTHGHHLTPAEAKASSSTTASQSKGVSSSSSRPLAAPTVSSTKPTTRSQISRFLGK